MAKQVINTGTTGNDKTGDKLRIAFTKINQNFTEVYDSVASLNAADAASIATNNIRTNASFEVANAGFNKANSLYNIANTSFDAANQAGVIANAAFNKANTSVTDFSPAYNQANSAYSVANAAFNYANTIIGENTNLTDVFNVANAAYNKANTSVTDFSPAYNKANDAYSLANAAYVYANTIIGENTNLSDVFNVANAAFDKANTTPSMNLDSLTDVSIDYNTISAGYVLKWSGTGWAAGVDATSGGGGTDADTLEGQHGTYYLDYNNFSNTPNLLIYETTAAAALSFESANNYAGFMANSANAYVNTSTLSSNNYAGVLANTGRDAAMSVAASYYSTANNHMNNTVNAARDYTNTSVASANAYANVIGTSVNAYTVVVGSSSNAYANVVGAASNNWANTLLSTASNASIGNVNITYVLDSGRFTKLSGVEESVGVYNSVTGLFNFDCTSNYIFYITPTGNFTANLQNFLLDSNNVTSVSMILNQGVTPYMSINNVLINGANVAINWQGGTAPTGTASKKEVLTLSILNVGGSNTVFGQLVSFG